MEVARGARKVGMRGGGRERQQREKGKRRWTEGEQKVMEGKEKKSLIIYLEDTSSSTFRSGQCCSLNNSVCCVNVGKLFAVFRLEVWCSNPK